MDAIRERVRNEFKLGRKALIEIEEIRVSKYLDKIEPKTTDVIAMHYYCYQIKNRSTELNGTRVTP